MKPILITGGCGFIGSNIAAEIANRGKDAIVLDNFSRKGSKKNAQWLRERHGNRLEFVEADTRDHVAVDEAVKRASAVIHLAAQVAVTTSVDNPREDFAINAQGTLNVLEAVRTGNPEAPVLFASTNKVYGALENVQCAKDEEMKRYAPVDAAYAAGVGEEQQLDFHSPYGCSKGVADQYVRDYARVYGLRTAVLRMSCIYGTRQFGTEDQGWVAHFLLRALRREPITIYGDGYQVRDLLFIEDAVRGWLRVLESIDMLKGHVFNLGGGPDNAVSLLNLLARMRTMGLRPMLTQYSKWRKGDQPWYVSNTSKLRDATGWTPRIGVEEGLTKLHSWLAEGVLAPA